MTERDLKKYFGYRIMDEEVRRRVDEIRDRCPEKFEGVLEAKRRGYRWMIYWGERREMKIKKEGGKELYIPLEMILGGEIEPDLIEIR